MDKKSFVLFTDRKKEIDLLSNEQCGILFKAIFAYVDDDKQFTTDDLALQVLFSLMVSQINNNNQKWEEVKRKRSEAGKKGMASRWGKKSTNNNYNNVTSVITQDNKSKQDVTKITVTDTVTVTGTVTTVPVIEDGTALGGAAPPSEEKIIPWDDVDFELV